jgi:hypothetical protein
MQSTRYSCHISVKSEFHRQTFEKYSNKNFYVNSAIGSRVASVRTVGRTDTTKLIVAFRNFAKTPKNGKFVITLPKLCKIQVHRIFTICVRGSDKIGNRQIEREN